MPHFDFRQHPHTLQTRVKCFRSRGGVADSQGTTPDRPVNMGSLVDSYLDNISRTASTCLRAFLGATRHHSSTIHELRSQVCRQPARRYATRKRWGPASTEMNLTSAQAPPARPREREREREKERVKEREKRRETERQQIDRHRHLTSALKHLQHDHRRPF